jgi:hypothetical protein
MREVVSILVNSKDREKGSVSTSNFRVKLSRPLTNVVNCELRQLIISEGIYNLSELQSEFVISVAADQVYNTSPSFSVQTYIPVGYYTLSAFADAVETAIQAVFVDKTWSKEKRWITASVNDDKQLELYGYDNSFHFQISFPRLAAAKAFGYTSTAGEPSIQTADETGYEYQWLKSNIAIQIEMLEYLCLQSPELGDRLLTSAGLPAYDVVPIPDRIRPLVYTRYEAKAQPDFLPRALNDLNIRLVKPTGKVVDLRSNDVALLLEFVIEKK